MSNIANSIVDRIIGRLIHRVVDSAIDSAIDVGLYAAVNGGIKLVKYINSSKDNKQLASKLKYCKVVPIR